jgi:hypothetical protein
MKEQEGRLTRENPDELMKRFDQGRDRFLTAGFFAIPGVFGISIGAYSFIVDDRIDWLSSVIGVGSLAVSLLSASRLNFRGSTPKK